MSFKSRRLSKEQSQIDPSLANLPLEQLLERTSSNNPDDALPAYSVAPKNAPLRSRSPPPDFNVAAPFASLKLSNEPPVFPSADTCLAHLKLLYAFRNLKEDVGYTDGLWGIKDPEPSTSPDARLLSRLREKRWAVYLGRAVDRYEAWWNSFEGKKLVIGDMETKGSVAYNRFTMDGESSRLRWDEVMMMPLGKSTASRGQKR